MTSRLASTLAQLTLAFNKTKLNESIFMNTQDVRSRSQLPAAVAAERGRQRAEVVIPVRRKPRQAVRESLSASRGAVCLMRVSFVLVPGRSAGEGTSRMDSLMRRGQVGEAQPTAVSQQGPKPWLPTIQQEVVSAVSLGCMVVGSFSRS